MFRPMLPPEPQSDNLSVQDVLMPRSGGFTLIEIMVVMLVIGVIMSMAALSINLNQSNILETEIKRIDRKSVV